MKVKLLAVAALITVTAAVLWWLSRTLSTSSGGSNETSDIKLRNNFYYSMTHTTAHSTYPICSKLASLSRNVAAAETTSVETEKNYSSLLHNGHLQCGNRRVQTGFSKSVVTPWTGCAKEIVPAKRRLLTFMEDLCRVQSQANQHCRPQASEHDHEPTPKQYASLCATATTTPSAPSVHRHSGALRRGVIYTGRIKHFRDIYQSVYALRLSSSVLPVEVWVNAFAFSTCEAVFRSSSSPRDMLELHNVHCRRFGNEIVSFASKFYALLYTDFEEVLFMDADNMAVRNVGELFESPGYRATGAVLWPDIYSSACSSQQALKKGDTGARPQLSGQVGRPDFVLFAANFSDLQWSDSKLYAQETEAGQMVLNLNMHRGLVNLGRRLYEDNRFFRQALNGDKDIFRLIFLLTHTPFHYITDVPGYSLDDSDRRDCLVHYHRHHWSQPPRSQHKSRGHGQHHQTIGTPNDTIASSSRDDSSEAGHSIPLPLFFHQLKARSPTAFGRYVRHLPESTQMQATRTANMTPSAAKSVSEEPSRPVCLPITTDLEPLPSDHPLQKKWFVANRHQVVQARGSQGRQLYLLETPTEGPALVRFASTVFCAVDRVWATGVFRHQLSFYLWVETYMKFVSYMYMWGAAVIVFVICVMLCMWSRRGLRIHDK